jgi:hypothetical protein
MDAEELQAIKEQLERIVQHLAATPDLADNRVG